MSLKQKILENAQSIAKLWINEKDCFKEKAVALDVVYGLLDTSTDQILAILDKRIEDVQNFHNFKMSMSTEEEKLRELRGKILVVLGDKKEATK